MFRKCNALKFLLILAVILVCLPVTNAYAASKLNLYYYTTKQNVTYTGQQVKYTYNGKAIKMGNTPGIIIDGTSLASFNNVFVKSAIKMSYKYNNAKGVLTLSKNGTTLTLTAGSKSAILNGKTVKLSIAPMKVRFKDQKVSKFLVPARFVAESFGYKYVWSSSTSTASITAPMHLYYNNKDVFYSGTKGNVTVDGDSISLNSMHSIIINDTAMLCAYKVFGSGPIGAGYKYNSSTKKLTITLNDTVVELTMGSKTAMVNGKERLMDTAPLYITNRDTNKSYVMVPGSFVASYLGYDYAWNSSTKTSVITTRIPEDEHSNEGEDGPELGGDPLPDSVVLKWEMEESLTDELEMLDSLTGVTEISEDTTVSANIYSVEKDTADTDSYEIFSIHSMVPFSSSILTLEGQDLNLHINNSYAETAADYNFNSNLTESISATTDYSDLSTDINFTLLNPDTEYDLSLSDDKCTLYVTLYSNYLTGIEAGISSGKEYVKISSLKPLNVNLSEDGNKISLQIPDTVNGVGENYMNTALNSLQSVQSTSLGTNTSGIVLERADLAEYTVTTEDNTYLITFDSGVSQEEPEYALTINIPSEVFFSEVTNEDLYYKNQIILRIPGDYSDYYYTNPITSSSSVVKGVTVYYKNSMTEIVINTSKLQGYKLTDLGGTIGVVLGNPRDIYKNIVVLDAGHGGTDPGAMRKLDGVTIKEKDLNFKMMYQLTQKYFNAEDSEIKAYYSRYDNTKVDLYDRAAFADKVGADLFVSLHMNANNSSTPKGTEIYYTGSNTATTANGLNSKILANIFLNSLPDMVGTDKRYISNKSLAVCRANTVPAILVELGFMSNSSDLKKMEDPEFQENTAQAIYNILCDVFSAYPTGR